MNTKIIAIAVAAAVLGGAVGFGAPILKRVKISVAPETGQSMASAAPVAQASTPVKQVAKQEEKPKPAERVLVVPTIPPEEDDGTEAGSMAIYDPNPSDKTALNVIKKMYKQYQGHMDAFGLLYDHSTKRFAHLINNCGSGDVDHDLMFNTDNTNFGAANHNKVKIAYSGYGYSVDVSLGGKELMTYNMSCKNKSCKIKDIVLPGGTSMEEKLVPECKKHPIDVTDLD